MMATQSIIGQDKTVYFSDFSFDFSPHPKTGDISVLNNNASVQTAFEILSRQNMVKFYLMLKLVVVLITCSSIQWMR